MGDGFFEHSKENLFKIIECIRKYQPEIENKFVGIITLYFLRLISSGATLEKIDEARAITNLSSGLMGLNLAKMAYTMGAEVTSIS